MGLIGGTFDPVHHGHLDAADAARLALGLDEVTFIPAHVPPHRPARPRASAFHRFALLALALEGRAGYRASDMELVRNGPSFTVDTLRDLHGKGWRPSQLFFIIGADAFAEIATWREYPAVLDAARFAVMARPGSILDSSRWAPELRGRLRPAGSPDADDKGVAIHVVDATTRDISSSQVRARIASGDSIADLVPAAVADYIAAHHLYERVDELHG
jgi:nicotinate-nucleotide adenylyltransferase